MPLLRDQPRVRNVKGMDSAPCVSNQIAAAGLSVSTALGSQCHTGVSPGGTPMSQVKAS